jgi:multidrug efflux pump subunit AcrB
MRQAFAARACDGGRGVGWKGEVGNSAEANAGLAKTMRLSFGTMFLVALILFSAWRQMIIVRCVVPLRVIEVIDGLAGTQTAMEFMAILRVVPLLLEPFFKSLAGVIICGLTFATVLTLIMGPAVYTILFRVAAEEMDYVGVTRQGGPPA